MEVPLCEGFIGEVLPDRNRDNKHVLFTHKSLVINYNGNQVGLKQRIFTKDNSFKQHVSACSISTKICTGR